MIRINSLLVILSLMLISSFSWSIEVEPYADVEQGDAAGFQDFFARVAPNVYVSGQPGEEGLSAMQAQGVTRHFGQPLPYLATAAASRSRPTMEAMVVSHASTSANSRAK